MGRVLVLVGLALLVAYLLDSGMRRLRARRGAPRRAAPAGSAAGGATTRAGELVVCAACGVHVLRSRALPAGLRRDAFYCSETCRSRVGSAA